MAPIVYLPPKAERWRAQTADVHIVCSEWIESYWHAATYRTGEQWFDGKYISYHYKLVDRHDYLFKGIFERATHHAGRIFV